MATQNPIEQAGTYKLPEAQLDRFLLKVIVTYPSKDEEKTILRQNTSEISKSIKSVVSPQQILKSRDLVRKIYIDEKIENYITDIVFASRFPAQYKMNQLTELLRFGASPRASINLALAAKAFAFIKGRAYVIPEDIRALATDVMRHRIGLTYEAEAQNVTAEQIINEILNTIEVP